MQLSCEKISFKYKNSKYLFENLDFAINKGEKVCIFAKSGFGKSSFAKVLAGYEKPNQGHVLLSGNKVSGYSPVQLIYQHPEKSVNPKWTVEQILLEGGEYDTEILRKFGIDKSFFNRFPHELSGGELQRICIVRALKKQTEFLICDEITTMLDAINQANIWKCILEEVERRNLGLLVITHNKSLANKICEKVIDFEELCMRC
ncbi:MAG: ATP-binding cassette domain-containing protein [Clostridia bacterium]